jgi:hypothetical protein
MRLLQKSNINYWRERTLPGLRSSVSGILVAILTSGFSLACGADWRDQATAQQQAELVAECAKGRYLNKGVPEGIELPNWKGFETKKYTYAASNGWTVSVVLLDADPGKCADWVGNAVVDVLGTYKQERAIELAVYIVKQSGFHFPVAGLVDEQSEGIYAFRDGVTVRLKDLPTVPGWFKLRPDFEVTDKLRDYAVWAQPSEITAIGAQARPDSIAVEEFEDGHKPADPGSPHTPWNLADIRAAYQDGWRSKRNALVTNLLKVYPDGAFPR